MTRRLLLICHGATAATRAGVFAADEPLEPRSLAQAAAAAPLRPRPGRAVASPARRALETAAALRLDATIEPALRDLECGNWAGLTLDAVAQREPGRLEAWLRDPSSAPPGGETLDAMLRRVGGWMDGLDPGGPTLAAVTHPAVIRAALVHGLGAPPASFWRIDVAPLAVARFSGTPGAWRLQGLAPLDRESSDA